MNTPTLRTSGSVVVGAVMFLLIGFILVSSYLALSAHDTRLTRLSIDDQKARILAEAGLEYGILKLRDAVFQYHFNPSVSTNALQVTLDSIPPPSNMPPYAYITPSGQPAFRLKIESVPVDGIISNGTACRGSYGTVQFFSITVGCLNTNSGKGAVLKQTVQAVGLCLIRFGVFYDEDLEIIPGATMTFSGPVHCNGNIYIGGPLTFSDRLTAHGNIYHKRKDKNVIEGEAKAEDATDVLKSFKLSNGQWLDGYHTDWMVQALTRWGGTVMSFSHGVPRLSPPINPVDMPHDIIERPLPTNHPAYNPTTEKEKFSNKAALRLYFSSNGTLTATDFFTNDVTAAFSNALPKKSGTTFLKNNASNYILAVTGVYDTTQTDFKDAREKTNMAPVDIYVDRLIAAYPALYTGYTEKQGRGVIYITRDDPDGLSNGVMPCIRLRNGTEISNAIGLSVVSDLPVYVEGDYNTVNTKPALVAGDAVTFLSKNWQDKNSYAADSVRTAVNTTYKTVIMTGNTLTTAGSYNGGLENVLRFLENWSGNTATFRGSIIDIWRSELANSKWPGTGTQGGLFRYNPPTRDWGYDPIYRTQSPPGMTYVFGMEEIEWERSTWANAGW